MRRPLIVALFALLALPAAAQVNPLNLPANTVVGRTAIGPGPAQAIPFSILGLPPTLIPNCIYQTNGSSVPSCGTKLFILDDNTVTTSEVQLGTGGVNNSLRSAFQVLRSLTGAAELSIHAFADNTTFNFSSSPGGTNGANSFDSRTNHIGNQNYDHFNSFQSLLNFASTGTMTGHTGFDWAATVTNGTVTTAYGALLHTPSISGPGSIGTVYGIYIQEMAVGTGGADRAIFTAGTAASQFGGYVISGTGIIVRNAAPAVLLQSAGAVTIGSMAHDGTNFTIDNAANGPLIFQTNNANAGRFHASGALSVGNTTDDGAGAIRANSTINAVGGFKANSTAGLSTTCTVTAGNTLVFTGGILTTKGANCT